MVRWERFKKISNNIAITNFNCRGGYWLIRTQRKIIQGKVVIFHNSYRNRTSQSLVRYKEILGKDGRGLEQTSSFQLHKPSWWEGHQTSNSASSKYKRKIGGRKTRPRSSNTDIEEHLNTHSKVNVQKKWAEGMEQTRQNDRKEPSLSKASILLLTGNDIK